MIVVFWFEIAESTAHDSPTMPTAINMITPVKFGKEEEDIIAQTLWDCLSNSALIVRGYRVQYVE